MKHIKDIEFMTPEELEIAALAESAPVPEGLESRIKETLAAKAATEAAPRSAGFRDRFGWAPAVALAAFAAIAILIAIPGNSPKDTFDDPAMAYAQVEAVFKDISGRIASGMDKVSQAEAIASKPSEIINKTNRK